MAQKILTESGINEMEFLEFQLGEQSYGINVEKLLQIIPYKQNLVTATPGTAESVIGSLLWRDQTIDLIDLTIALKEPRENIDDRSVVLVTKFNNLISGFWIDSVRRIHRISWKEIKAFDDTLNKYEPRFTGMVCVEDRIILLVDFEKIVFDLNPELTEESIAKEAEQQKKQKRNECNIIFAEDSNVIRDSITEYLNKAGYRIRSFENGQKAFDYANGLLDDSTNTEGEFQIPFDLLITDIEMPQMDGLTLCRQIKKSDRMKNLPVLIFSSLINDQMINKCKEVDANAYITKPGSKDLLKKVDELLLINAI